MGGLVELSHRVEHGMTTYPGLPGPEIGDHLARADSRGRYAPGVEFQIGWIRLVANTGTYLDTPFHRYEGGTDLADVPLDRIADVAGVVIDARPETIGGRAVTPDVLGGVDVADRAVLLYTGWDRHWRTPHYGAAEHPYVTAAAAEYLVAQGAALVGIDSVNVDDVADPERPAHSVLLGAGVLIVEHMTGLGALPSAGFRFHAVPTPVVGMGTFPVRAYAVVG